MNIPDGGKGDTEEVAALWERGGDLELSPAETWGVNMRDDIVLYIPGPETRGDNQSAIA